MKIICGTVHGGEHRALVSKHWLVSLALCCAHAAMTTGNEILADLPIKTIHGS